MIFMYINMYCDDYKVYKSADFLSHWKPYIISKMIYQVLKIPLISERCNFWICWNLHWRALSPQTFQFCSCVYGNSRATHVFLPFNYLMGTPGDPWIKSLLRITFTGSSTLCYLRDTACLPGPHVYGKYVRFVGK